MNDPRLRAWRTPSARTLFGVVGNVVAVVGVLFVLRTLVARVDALPALRPTLVLVLAFVGGVVVQIAAVLLASSSWRALLRGAGVDHAWRDCFRAIGGSAVAKYVPGNIFHLVGRTTIASADGLATGVVVGSMAVEAVVVLLSAVVIGSPALASRVHDLRALLPAHVLLGAVFVVLVGLAVVIFLAVGPLRRRSTRTPLRTLGVVFALNLLTFVLLGGALAFVLAAIPGVTFTAGAPDTLGLFIACVQAFSLAWALGFVVPGAPGGIGVREAVFLLLMPQHDDVFRAAVVVALVVGRLQSVTADVIVFIVARALPRRLPAPTQPSSSLDLPSP